MWKEGSISVCGQIYHYWAKVYDAPGKYGINGGRVSKLTVKTDGKTVINYDRGWDIRPGTQEENAVLWIILNSHN